MLPFVDSKSRELLKPPPTRAPGDPLRISPWLAKRPVMPTEVRFWMKIYGMLVRKMMKQEFSHPLNIVSMLIWVAVVCFVAYSVLRMCFKTSNSKETFHFHPKSNHWMPKTSRPGVRIIPSAERLEATIFVSFFKLACQWLSIRTPGIVSEGTPMARRLIKTSVSDSSDGRGRHSRTFTGLS